MTSFVKLSWTNIDANKELKSYVGTSIIEEVVNPIVVDPTPVFTPVKSTLPIPLVPIPAKSVLKSIFNNLISWSFRNFSVGSNKRFFVPVANISVSKSPNLTVVKSVDFSSKKASLSVVIVTISENWESRVSGSTIWTRYWAKSSIKGSITVLVLSNPSLEKPSLISSCSKTLFVLHLVKSVNVLFWNVKNLDPLTLVS